MRAALGHNAAFVTMNDARQRTAGLREILEFNRELQRPREAPMTLRQAAGRGETKLAFVEFMSRPKMGH